MKIECPACKVGGSLPDHEIPDEGIQLSCPRCKHNFHLPKPRKKMTSIFATNTCPACGYSTFCEEVFDECPKCGVLVQTLVQRKQEDEARRREQEILNRNYRAAVPPVAASTTTVPLPTVAAKVEKSRVRLADFADGFNPIAAVGWGAAASAVVLLLIGLWGVIHYLGSDIQEALSQQSIEPVSAWRVFWGYGFFPWAELLFGLVVAAAAFGFLRQETWGLRFMQQVVLATLVIVPLYELAGYIIWIVESVDPPWWAYLVELLSAMLFSALWMVPLYFLWRYLQGNSCGRQYREHQSFF